MKKIDAKILEKMGNNLKKKNPVVKKSLVRILTSFQG
jgi:hypothetical protein